MKTTARFLAIALLLSGCAALRSAEEAVEDAATAVETEVEADAKAVASVVTGEGGCLPGIDVSHFQGNVDWARVKAAGNVFGYAKATQGLTEVDPKFSENWAAMGKAGILRGAYHFYQTDDDPDKQLAQFTSTVTLGPGDLPPMVDVEIESKNGIEGSLAAELAQFLTGLQSHYGVAPFVYTNSPFWNAHIGKSLGEYPLWIAEYGVKKPKLPKGWTVYSVWQHAQTGKVDGVSGDVDVDCFNGSAEQLEKFRLPG